MGVDDEAPPPLRAQESPAIVRSKLESVLQDKMAFLKSARRSFAQFDEGNTNTLEYEKILQLVSRLCRTLMLPPIDEKTLLHIFKKYDTEQDGHLSLDEFIQFYWRLLWRVKEKYYPSRNVLVRREQYVGRHALQCDIKTIFDFEKRIGGGSFGEVYLVRDRSDESLLRVCKMIDKSQAAVPMDQIEAEIIVLKRLDHPNIIKIYEVYEDDVYVYIIMEYCSGGELLEKILQLSAQGEVMAEQYTAQILYQIFKALSYFHCQDIVHKDLKPENILFHDNATTTVKVIDFGLAEIFHRTSATSGGGGANAGAVDESVYSHNAAGTVLYMAPEVFQRRVHLKCDIWSAGCLGYLMMTGHLPYSGKSVGEIREKVVGAMTPKYLRGGSSHLSSLAIDLLRQCLTPNVKQRPTAKQVLEHPWFSHVTDVAPRRLPARYLANFRKISKVNELKLCMLNLVAHQLDLTNPQVQEIGRVFVTADTDHTGTLSVAELRHVLNVHSSTSSSEEERPDSLTLWEFNRVFQILDIDDDGEVSYTEFLTAAYTWRQSEITLVWTAFNKLEPDDQGRLSVDQLIRLLSSTASRSGGPSSPGATTKRLQRLKAAIKKLDQNNDGYIDWNEFVAYIRGKA